MDIVKDVLLPQFKPELRKYDVCICVMDLLARLHGVPFLLKQFLAEDGWGNDVYGFNFPNIYEPYECNEDGYFASGVQFYYHEQTQLISNGDFAAVVEALCAVYQKLNPHLLEPAIEPMMQQTISKFGVQKDKKAYSVTENELSVGDRIISFPHCIYAVESTETQLLILLEIPPDGKETDNIYAVGWDGAIRWRIQNRSAFEKCHSQMPYVGMRVMNEHLKVIDFCGIRYWVNPENGHIIERDTEGRYW